MKRLWQKIRAPMMIVSAGLCFIALGAWGRSKLVGDVFVCANDTRGLVVSVMDGVLRISYSHGRGAVNPTGLWHESYDWRAQLSGRVSWEELRGTWYGALGLGFDYHNDAGRQRSAKLFTIYVPFWLLVLITVVPASVAVTRNDFQRRRERRRLGLCPQCGYDLRATPDRCPECGAVPRASGAEE